MHASRSHPNDLAADRLLASISNTTIHQIRRIMKWLAAVGKRIRGQAYADICLFQLLGPNSGTKNGADSNEESERPSHSYAVCGDPLSLRRARLSPQRAAAARSRSLPQASDTDSKYQ